MGNLDNYSLWNFSSYRHIPFIRLVCTIWRKVENLFPNEHDLQMSLKLCQQNIDSLIKILLKKHREIIIIWKKGGRIKAPIGPYFTGLGPPITRVLCTYFHDCIWLHMTAYDYIWLHVTTCDYIWLHMTAYDYIWLHMTTYDYIWLHIMVLRIPFSVYVIYSTYQTFVCCNTYY